MADLEKLDNAINDFLEQSDNLKEFSQVYSEISKLKNDISRSLDLLKTNNEGFELLSGEILQRLRGSEQQLEKLETSLLKKIQELYLDNKNFQKELDSSILSRLEKHKSDIQVEVRSEGSQIQRAFENSLNTNFINMMSKVEDLYDEQSKQITLLKTLLFLVLGVTIGLMIIIFIK